MGSNLEKLTQQSVINWINNVDTHGITVAVAPRHFEQDKTTELTLPTIIVRAVRLREEIKGSGVWQIKVEVSLIAQADDTDDATLNSQWSNLQDVLNWDELAARLSDLDGFHCYGTVLSDPSDKSVIERYWQFKFEFLAFCMTQDFMDSDISESSSGIWIEEESED